MKTKIYSFLVFSILLLSYNLPEASTIKSISFHELSLPEKEEEKLITRISPKATIYYTDGSKKELNIGYAPLLKSGDEDREGDIFGLLYDKNNEPLGNRTKDNTAGANIDGNSVLKIGERYYLLTNIESIPGAVYITELIRKGNRLEAADFTAINFAPVNGTFRNCASSVTPWNTHLGGEEDTHSNFDAFFFDPTTSGHSEVHTDKCRIYSTNDFCKTLNLMKDYLKVDSYSEINPYDYGYIFEISLDKSTVEKHYSMGKGAPELAYVMPDKKTAYISDDRPYGGFYMYVADKPEELSSGSLYMARWEQTSKDKGGGAILEWVFLGHASDKEIKSIIDKRPLFSDIFDVGNPLTCPGNFRLLKAGLPNLLCLRLKDGRNDSNVSQKFKNQEEVLKAAAFLETRKFGAYMGATAEWSRGEGITYSPETNTLYMAITSITEGMLNIETDPMDHIRLEENKCGALYSTILKPDKKINSDYVATEIKALLTGIPLKEGDKYSTEYSCHPDYISNPDNLGSLKNIVFIGEDAKGHINSMVWAYDTETGKLTRVMTIPSGAEITGSFANLETKDNHYIFINIQHPFQNESFNATGSPSNLNLLKRGLKMENKGQVGYIYGLPAVNGK